jgi:hypothetical protein
LVRNPWPKPTSVLEHCREGETNNRLSIFGASPSDNFPTVKKDVKEHSFIHNFKEIPSISNSCKLDKQIPGTS